VVCEVQGRPESMAKKVVEILGGIPGVGKTKFTDSLFRSEPAKRKIYLPLSHKQAEEREDFLTGMDITHWYGMKLICPLLEKEPIKTLLDIGAPTRWICQICQAQKLIEVKVCPHKIQFKNPANTVIAPVAYLFTQHVEKYKPDIVVVDDIILQKQDLPTRNEMKRYVGLLHYLGFCDYKTLEELFEEEGSRLKQYILNTIEPKVKGGVKRLLDEGSDFSKESSKILLQVEPMTLVEWFRLVQVYGWQEEFCVPFLMPVFQLALEKGRRVIIVGAQINKPFLEMFVRCFQKEYGYPITLKYRRMKLNQPLPNSIVYRARSPKYGDAWYPTTTSIVKSKVTRRSIKQRIEGILISQEQIPSTIGIIKPKKAPLVDFIPSSAKCSILSLDFGSLRGSNKLEHCDILIIVGTYNVNITALQKDFVKFFHRNPWTIEAVKQLDGGYEYVGDSDLENFRMMMEDYEMYQAIHRCRPALYQRKIYVFGLIPREIRDEFQIKDLTFEKFEKDRKGGMYLIEWKSFDKFVKEQIGDKGIYMADLVKLVIEEEKITKRNGYERIHKFVEQYNEEYEIVDKKLGEMVLKYVQKRR